MAKPRIFISSTFYDLRFARVSLEGFIREMGYEPVLNERGAIPYSTAKELQEYCYAEISKVSMVVSIIGGRFGSTSNIDSKRSISNIELKTAIDQGKQVYIFIESAVHTEYMLYTKNKDNSIVYHAAEDRRIHEFIDEIYALPKNNQIFTFTEIPQIIAYLKEQWAGLFENYLEQKNQEVIGQSITRLEATAQTLNSLVSVFRNQSLSDKATFEEKEVVLNGIVLQNHPIFGALREKLRVPYRVFFTSKHEFLEWLQASRNGEPIDERFPLESDYFEYTCKLGKDTYVVQLKKSLFDSYGNLKVMLPSEWDEDIILFGKLNSWDKPTSNWDAPKADLDDDIPF